MKNCPRPTSSCHKERYTTSRAFSYRYVIVCFSFILGLRIIRRWHTLDPWKWYCLDCSSLTLKLSHSSVGRLLSLAGMHHPFRIITFGEYRKGSISLWQFLHGFLKSSVKEIHGMDSLYFSISSRFSCGFCKKFSNYDLVMTSHYVTATIKKCWKWWVHNYV